jgi:hypothetical protein
VERVVHAQVVCDQATTYLRFALPPAPAAKMSLLIEFGIQSAPLSGDGFDFLDKLRVAVKAEASNPSPYTPL